MLMLRAMQSREVQWLLSGAPWTELCATVSGQLAAVGQHRLCDPRGASVHRGFALSLLLDCPFPSLSPMNCCCGCFGVCLHAYVHTALKEPEQSSNGFILCGQHTDLNPTY